MADTSPAVGHVRQPSNATSTSRARSSSSVSTVRLSTELQRIGTPASRHVTAGSKPPSKNTSFLRICFDDVCLTPDVLDHGYYGSGTEEDPYVCEFIPNDHRNPQNWPKPRKWLITLSVALATFAISFCSSAYSGAVGQIIDTFHVSEEVVTLGLSLFVFGYVIGPLVWGPMSELYGRRWLFIGTYTMLTIFNAGCAGSNTMTTLIVLRTFAGIFGSSPLTNAGGAIADMFQAEDRGVAMALFSSAPFLGPSVGPIVGGFAGESIGWRWVMGIMAILSGVLLFFGLFTIPETYGPVILERRASALRKATGKNFRTRMEIAGKRPTPTQAFKTALSRPWILLFREPIVLVTSIYMAIVYGTLYMMFAAFPIVYQEQRGWSEGIGGLAFIGILVGMMVAVFLTIPDNSTRYVKANNKAIAKGLRQAPAEERLPPGMLGAVMLPIGLFWFAWTNGPNIHWIVSIIGSAPFGFGMVLVFLSIMNYLIDSYTIYAASVLAANSVLRSLFGTVFPLFTSQMYQNLGVHWASSVPAFLALACAPFPFLFYRYGDKIRAKCKYSRKAEEMMEEMMRTSDDPEEEQEQQQSSAARDVGLDATKANSHNSASTSHEPELKPERDSLNEKDIEKAI